MDGELDPSWISDDAVSGGEWTCDAYSSLGDLCAYQEIEQKCCHCRGGGSALQASTNSTTCVDDALPGRWSSGGAYTCDTDYQLYGSFFCSHGAIKESCCHCGGGTAVQASTTSAPCVDDTLNSEWSSGEGLTCAVLAGLDNTAHCDKDEIAQTCCHCASGYQVAISSLQVSLSMSSSEEGRDEVCKDDNLGTGGGVYRSYVWALHGAGVESREASITLSCTIRRLASNQVRRLQTDFVLTSTESFSNAGDAIAVSNIIMESSSNISLEFETQVASVLGVEVVATISHVEVVASDEAVSFVSPAPADQFPSGDPDTPCWDHGFKTPFDFFQPLTLKLFQSWHRLWVSTLIRVHLGTLPFLVGRRASLADVFVSPFIFYGSGACAAGSHRTRCGDSCDRAWPLNSSLLARRLRRGKLGMMSLVQFDIVDPVVHNVPDLHRPVCGREPCSAQIVAFSGLRGGILRMPRRVGEAPARWNVFFVSFFDRQHEAAEPGSQKQLSALCCVTDMIL